MAWPVYSRRVYAASISTTGAWVNVYTVPTGKVFILRRFTAVNLSGSARDGILGLNHDQQWVLLNAQASGTGVDREEWLVYEAGDEVSFYSTTGTWQVSVHGQLLDA